MHIVCVGLNHLTAPVEVRERVSFSGGSLQAALVAIRALDGVEQVLLLSTCNRTEIYTASVHETDGRAGTWLSQRSGLGADVLSPHLYELAGRAAAAHLCCVAVGIDSQVVGESEILGQVKAAAKAAQGAGTLGPELDKLVSAAISAGKRARSETAISRGAFSVGRCAVEKAKSVFETLEGRAILILGAGKMAESTARHLRSQGADPILVTNRTYSHAEQLAGELGGRALRYDQLTEGLRAADIVITSTSAPHLVLLREHVAEAMDHRANRDLFLIDIAVPRDVDPRVADVPGAHLFDIDDLGGAVEAAVSCRAAEVEAAHQIAYEAADGFWQWMAARTAVPLLAALRDSFEEARQDQVSRFAARIERLSPSERAWVDELTRALVNRLLHAPMVNLKHELALGNGKAAESFARMYGLDVDDRVAALVPSPGAWRSAADLAANQCAGGQDGRVNDPYGAVSSVNLAPGVTADGAAQPRPVATVKEQG